MKNYIYLLSIILFVSCFSNQKRKTLDSNQNIVDNQMKIIVGKNMYYNGTQLISANNNLPLLINNLDSSKYVLYSNIDFCPTLIKSFLSKNTNNAIFSIANVGEEWQVKDVIINSNLPTRQLKYLALSDTLLLLSYYKGGVG